MTKIEELQGIDLLRQPANSPDLAPSDYHLPRSMVHLLPGRNLENIEAVEVDLTEFFASNTRDWYRRGVTYLTEIRLKPYNPIISALRNSLISCQKTFQIKFC